MKLTPIVSLSLILFAAGGASAGALDFGIKGGVNIANIYGDDVDEEVDWKSGFSGGIFLDWEITPVLAIQPELLYVQYGSKQKSADVNWDIGMNYLQLPVLAVIDIPIDGPLVPVLFAGPYLGTLLDSKLETSVNGTSATLDIKDGTKSTDTGFVFGAAIDFGLGAGKMTIEGRYNLGLTEFDDGIGEAIGDEDPVRVDSKHKSWTIMIGYTY